MRSEDWVKRQRRAFASHEFENPDVVDTMWIVWVYIFAEDEFKV